MLLRTSFDWDYSPWLGFNLDALDFSRGSSHTTSHMTKTMGVIVSTDVPGYWTGYMMGSVEEFYEKNSRPSEHEISELEAK